MDILTIAFGFSAVIAIMLYLGVPPEMAISLFVGLEMGYVTRFLQENY